jgi:molybdopterin-guanine dinucleotide biosynthesis protein
VYGLEAAEIAAHQTREKKLNLSRDQVLAQHKAMAEIHGNQADKVVAQRAEMPVQVSASTEASIKEDLRVSMSRNMEREAVADERTILTDALRHGMGQLRAQEARQGLLSCVTDGQFLQMEGKETDATIRYTTPEMKDLELNILQQWREGVDKFYSLASLETRRVTLAQHAQLNDGQKNVVQVLLASQDRILGLEGTAGTGKTTALKAVCEAAKREGYELQGLAPTSRAAINLESAEINTKTIARHLSEARDSAKEAKRLYVVDESSMIGTRQMHELIKSLQPQDRVLFVGDTRQHEAVEAGRPYWQLRQAGMYTAELTEILRQKDPGLKAAVECLAQGDVGNAMEMMKEQGRITPSSRPFSTSGERSPKSRMRCSRSCCWASRRF